MDDARLDSPWTAVWRFGTTGQAARRPAADAQEGLSSSSTGSWSALKVGNGWPTVGEMGPCINESQRATVAKYVKIGATREPGCSAAAIARSGPHARAEPRPTISGTSIRRCGWRVRSGPWFGDPVDSPTGPSGQELRRIRQASIYTQPSTPRSGPCGTCTRDLRQRPTIRAETHLPFGGTKNTGTATGRPVQALDVFGVE